MFWENFWANFLSDVLVISLFGGGTYFLFRNKINQKINKVIINLENMVGNKIGKIIEKKTEQIATKGDNISIDELNVDNRIFRISGTRDSLTTQSEEDIKDIFRDS